VILDELVLHNFGVYRGRQRFELTPQSPDRPIVLIGAQNGSGKTTFLEGLQLAFFGPLAQAGLRGSVSYEDYLRRGINRSVAPEDGAEVQVTFRRVVSGREQVFCIRRAWSVQKDRLKEVFEVVVDGKLDRVLIDGWAEFVEEMLPPRIAPLFFFDGERIEQFADIDRSAAVIGTAVNALLGLDLVERLTLDLEVLERRKKAASVNKQARAVLTDSERAVHAAEDAAQTAYGAVGAARQVAERREAQAVRARQAFAAEGGDLFKAREELTAERARLAGAIDGVEKSLRTWAADCAPMLLAPQLIASVAAQGAEEAASADTRTILSHLAQRDARALEAMHTKGASPALIAALGAFFAEDCAALSAQAQVAGYLDLPSAAYGQLQGLMTDGLAAARAHQAELLGELDQLQAALDIVERKLAAIPAPEAIAPLLNAVALAEAELKTAQAALEDADAAYEAALREVTSLRSAYQGLLDKHVQHQLREEDAQRTIEHAARARATLAQFRRDVVRHHVHRLERLMLDALQQLLRKDDLVASVEIDPETFAITLRDGGWAPLPPEQLSAGERQLFAVALLWALAKASGQAAPTVIDTPLGRLDSTHRERLVERYFGRAGEQVILLSTDEEIDAKLYARLEPWLTRSFTIAYDAETRGSRVLPGYAFAAPDELEAA